MTFGNFSTNYGTNYADTIKASKFQVVLGLGGDDTLTADIPGIENISVLAGGLGNNTYIIGKGAVTGIVNSGGSDAVIFPFSTNSVVTEVLDNRHLLVYSKDTNTYVTLFDWESLTNKLDNFKFTDISLNAQQFGLMAGNNLHYAGNFSSQDAKLYYLNSNTGLNPNTFNSFIDDIHAASVNNLPDEIIVYGVKSSYRQDESIFSDQLYVNDKDGWDDVKDLDMQIINSAGKVIKDTSSSSFTKWSEGTTYAKTSLNQSLQGIAPGNYTLVFLASDRKGGSYSDPVKRQLTITAAAPIKYRDFTGDGKPDIIVQNVNQGWSGIWEMNGTTPTNKFTLLPTTSGAKISGMGDFNGDGKPDIILQNLNQGWSGIWEMNGTTPTNKFTLLPTTSGVISGVGDFNGDGKPDIILQGVDQSWSGILEMNGTTPTKWTALPTTSGVVCGVGDFNGDGKDDIVLQGVDQSWSGILEMNGTTPTKWTALPTTSGMKILGVGDFNGDGKSDIMLQNSNQSVSGIWTMNGAIPTAWTQLPITNGASII